MSVNVNTPDLRRSEARNKSIDHTHFYPYTPVLHSTVTSAAYEVPALPEAVTECIDTSGHYYVDIDVCGTLTGTLGIYLWNATADVPVLLTIITVDTDVQAIYRIEVGGRRLFIRFETVTSGAAVPITYTLV